MSGSSAFALRSLPLVVVIALVLAGGVAIAVGSASAEESVTSPLTQSTDTNVETLSAASLNESTAIESNTTFTIELQTNGDAHWTITERFNVSTDQQRQQFEELASDFESDTAEGSNLGFDAFERAGELVDAETPRTIDVTDDQRTSTVEGDVGTLTLSFTWENFARTDGNRLVLDDVYETEHGLWFPGLTENQELVIRSPDGFGFDDANVIPEQGQLVWEGPTTFSNETLQATLIGNGGGGVPGETPTATPTQTPSGGGGSGGSGIGSSIGLTALALGGVGALGAVVILAVLAVGTERVQAALTQATSQGGAAEEEPETEPPASDGTSESTNSDSEIDLGLLSDEERVERLIEQNGGRMKQATIVKETGWSNAKVSQLLSSMEEEDRINKLRIGRENLISFPDEDITEIGDK